MKFWRNSRAIAQVQMCEKRCVTLVNINAYINFGENLSICSQDIERKRNSSINQGP